jgi:hypothetical protein
VSEESLKGETVSAWAFSGVLKLAPSVSTLESLSAENPIGHCIEKRFGICYRRVGN